MEKQIQDMFELILGKLNNIEKDQQEMKQDMQGMKQEQQEMKQDMQEFKIRQDETYQIVRSLEENAKITRAEQDKMNHVLADIQGKITRLVEEVDEHDLVIRQIRAIE